MQSVMAVVTTSPCNKAGCQIWKTCHIFAFFPLKFLLQTCFKKDFDFDALRRLLHCLMIDCLLLWKPQKIYALEISRAAILCMLRISSREILSLPLLWYHLRGCQQVKAYPRYPILNNLLSDSDILQVPSQAVHQWKQVSIPADRFSPGVSLLKLLNLRKCLPANTAFSILSPTISVSSQCCSCRSLWQSRTTKFLEAWENTVAALIEDCLSGEAQCWDKMMA